MGKKYRSVSCVSGRRVKFFTTYFIPALFNRYSKELLPDKPFTTILNSSNQNQPVPRTIGFLGALGIGVGAMVGGGILALAGVGFAATGPSAILAFVLNGIIALITALSFAEMAAANPQSGGTYNYAKKALTLQMAFGVGWVVWFASLVAAVLYALGFGAFAHFALLQIPAGSYEWLLHSGFMPVILALGALG